MLRSRKIVRVLPWAESFSGKECSRVSMVEFRKAGTAPQTLSFAFFLFFCVVRTIHEKRTSMYLHDRNTRMLEFVREEKSCEVFALLREPRILFAKSSTHVKTKMQKKRKTLFQLFGIPPYSSCLKRGLLELLFCTCRTCA